MTHKTTLARKLRALGTKLNALAELRRPRSLKEKLERRFGHHKSAEALVADDVEELAGRVRAFVKDAEAHVAKYPLASIIGRLVAGLVTVHLLSRRS
jgi:DNA phosphorothioation-dependent restriction protein DptG